MHVHDCGSNFEEVGDKTNFGSVSSWKIRPDRFLSYTLFKFSKELSKLTLALCSDGDRQGEESEKEVKKDLAYSFPG